MLLQLKWFRGKMVAVKPAVASITKCKVIAIDRGAAKNFPLHKAGETKVIALHAVAAKSNAWQQAVKQLHRYFFCANANGYAAAQSVLTVLPAVVVTNKMSVVVAKENYLDDKNNCASLKMLYAVTNKFYCANQNVCAADKNIYAALKKLLVSIKNVCNAYNNSYAKDNHIYAAVKNFYVDVKNIYASMYRSLATRRVKWMWRRIRDGPG